MALLLQFSGVMNATLLILILSFTTLAWAEDSDSEERSSRFDVIEFRDELTGTSSKFYQDRHQDNSYGRFQVGPVRNVGKLNWGDPSATNHFIVADAERMAAQFENIKLGGNLFVSMTGNYVSQVSLNNVEVEGFLIVQVVARSRKLYVDNICAKKGLIILSPPSYISTRYYDSLNRCGTWEKYYFPQLEPGGARAAFGIFSNFLFHPFLLHTKFKSYGFTEADIWTLHRLIEFRSHSSVASSLESFRRLEKGGDYEVSKAFVDAACTWSKPMEWYQKLTLKDLPSLYVGLNTILVAHQNRFFGGKKLGLGPDVKDVRCLKAVQDNLVHGAYEINKRWAGPPLKDGVGRSRGEIHSGRSQPHYSTFPVAGKANLDYQEFLRSYVIERAILALADLVDQIRRLGPGQPEIDLLSLVRSAKWAGKEQLDKEFKTYRLDYLDFPEEIQPYQETILRHFDQTATL